MNTDDDGWRDNADRLDGYLDALSEEEAGRVMSLSEEYAEALVEGLRLGKVRDLDDFEAILRGVLLHYAAEATGKGAGLPLRAVRRVPWPEPG